MVERFGRSLRGRDAYRQHPDPVTGVRHQRSPDVPEAAVSVERQHLKPKTQTTRWSAIEMVGLLSIVWALAAVGFAVLVRI